MQFILIANIQKSEKGSENSCTPTCNFSSIALIYFYFSVIGITGTAHPVHIHGHKFQVVKVGFPSYNETTGLFEQNNPGYTF